MAWPQLVMGDSTFTRRSVLADKPNSVYKSGQSTRLSGTKSVRLVIVTYLPRQLQLHLEAALPPHHTIVPVNSWASVASAIRGQHVDLLLVDPAIDGNPDTDRVSQLIADFPSVAVVAYTTMMPATVSSVYQLTKQGLHQAVIYKFDDTRERLALLLDGIPSRSFLPAVVSELQPNISKLPKLVQRRVMEVLETPLRFASVTQFTQSLNMSRTVLYELFGEAGLGSPGRLLVAARLIQAYAYLQDPGVSVRATTAKVQWDDARTLKRYLVRAFGMPVEHLRQQGSTDVLAKRLADWIRVGEQ